jgi:hypothetical protein
VKKLLVTCLIFLTGCVYVIRQEGQPDQSIDPVNPEVRVRAWNYCAPVLNVTTPEGRVFRILFGRNALIILKHYAGTSRNNYSEPLTAEALSAVSGGKPLGSISESFEVNQNRWGHTVPWEITHLNKVPLGSPGCTGGAKIS